MAKRPYGGYSDAITQGHTPPLSFHGFCKRIYEYCTEGGRANAEMRLVSLLPLVLLPPAKSPPKWGPHCQFWLWYYKYKYKYKSACAFVCACACACVCNALDLPFLLTCSFLFYTDPIKPETPCALSDAVSGECVQSLLLRLVFQNYSHSNQHWCGCCVRE